LNFGSFLGAGCLKPPAADAAVLERIAAVMAYLHSGGGGRGGRKAGRTKEAADFIRNILAGGAAGGQGSGEADTKVRLWGRGG